MILPNDPLDTVARVLQSVFVRLVLFALTRLDQNRERLIAINRSEPLSFW